MARLLIALGWLFVWFVVYKTFCRVAPRLKHPGPLLDTLAIVVAVAIFVTPRVTQYFDSHSGGNEDAIPSSVPTSTTTTTANPTREEPSATNDACESSSEIAVSPPPRFGGDDRVTNSVLVAETLASQVTGIHAAILVNESDTASGAIAVPLASVLCAPILLVPSTDSLQLDETEELRRSERIRQFITENLQVSSSTPCAEPAGLNSSPTADDVSEADILVVGPLAGISSEWINWFNDTCAASVQVWNENHASTSALLATFMSEIRFGMRAHPVCGFTPYDVFFVATEIDALIVAPVAYRVGVPILLDKPAATESSENEDIELNTDIRAFLTKGSKIPVSRVWVLGGARAAPDSLLAQIEVALGNGNPPVDRIGGRDRFETAVNLAKHGVANGCELSEFIGIARVITSSVPEPVADHAPDGPSAAVYLGEIGAHLFLIDEIEETEHFDCSDPEMLIELRNSVTNAIDKQVVTFGGTKAIGVGLRDWYRSAWIDGTLPDVCVLAPSQ